jgi:hypothetical protein
MLDQIAQTQPHQFEERHGDAFPPLIGLDFLDQDRLLGDRGNSGLIFEGGCDFQKLLAQRVKTLRSLEQRQLKGEH